MALNIEPLAEEAKKHVSKGLSYWMAALKVTNNNERLAREICSVLGKRGGQKTAKRNQELKIQKEITRPKHGQQKFNF